MRLQGSERGEGKEVVESMIGRDEKRLAQKLNERKEGRKEEKREGKEARGKERKKKRVSLRNWRQRKEEATGA